MNKYSNDKLYYVADPDNPDTLPCAIVYKGSVWTLSKLESEIIYYLGTYGRDTNQNIAEDIDRKEPSVRRATKSLRKDGLLLRDPDTREYYLPY